MVDKSYIFQVGFLFGGLCGTALSAAMFYPGFGNKYQELLRETKYLISSQKGIVTVSDLVFKAEITPQKAAKFLKKLAQQLEIEPEVNDSGAIYYVFDSGEEISKQRQLKGDS